MKFEKFFKSVGTHGQIVKVSNNETWLLCDGVGMRTPNGVNNIGVCTEPNAIFNAIVNTEPDDYILSLIDAIITKADGKAKDIIRIFENAKSGDKIGINNADYGLLEKSDILNLLEVEDENNINHKFMIVRNKADDESIIGFITGYDNI